MASLFRPGARATAVGAAVLLAFPAAASARERDVPGARPLPTMAAPTHVHLNDTVLEGAVASAANTSGPTRA